MAVSEPDADDAFVGETEGDLGGAQEVYDLQGAGSNFLKACRLAISSHRLLCRSHDLGLIRCFAERFDEDSDSDHDQDEGVTDDSIQSFSRHKGMLPMTVRF